MEALPTFFFVQLLILGARKNGQQGHNLFRQGRAYRSE